MPVTFTEKVQDAPSPKVAPDRLTLFDPEAAVMVPPPQLPVRPFGVDTTRPEGKVSVKPTAVRETVAFGLMMSKLKAVEPPIRIVDAANALLMTGGATTVMVAEAVPPFPP
jgi:hypothetical protein